MKFNVTINKNSKKQRNFQISGVKIEDTFESVDEQCKDVFPNNDSESEWAILGNENVAMKTFYDEEGSPFGTVTIAQASLRVEFISDKFTEVSGKIRDALIGLDDINNYIKDYEEEFPKPHKQIRDSLNLGSTYLHNTVIELAKYQVNLNLLED